MAVGGRYQGLDQTNITRASRRIFSIQGWQTVAIICPEGTGGTKTFEIHNMEFGVLQT
jgi:hypothetical protein